MIMVLGKGCLEPSVAWVGAGRDVTLHRLRRGRAVGPNLTLETPSEKSHISLDALRPGLK